MRMKYQAKKPIRNDNLHSFWMCIYGLSKQINTNRFRTKRAVTTFHFAHIYSIEEEYFLFEINLLDICHSPIFHKVIRTYTQQMFIIVKTIFSLLSDVFFSQLLFSTFFFIANFHVNLKH